MKPIHIALAVGLTVIWGLNFVVITFGLKEIPPIFFAALRFFVVSLPVLVMKRPNIPWKALVAVSMTMFVGQFAFLMPGMKIGFPAGLASLTLQVQALFTALIAMTVLGERLKPNNVIGMGFAFAGLALIASTVGTGGVTLLGFAFLMGSALSWASGNVIMRANPPSDMLALICWMSALAWPPLLLLSLWLEGPAADWQALSQMNWVGLASLAYIAIPTTLIGYGIWGMLLKRYPAAQVAPFTLLVPVTGTLSAYLILGETFSSIRFVGMAMIMTGLVIHVFGARLPFLRATPQT